MNRIRFAMAPDGNGSKLNGTVECDETYIGPRKPRYRESAKRDVEPTRPRFSSLLNARRIRRRVVADVRRHTLKGLSARKMDRQARI